MGRYVRKAKPSTTAAVVASTLLLWRDDPGLGHLVDAETRRSIEAAAREVVPLFGRLLDHVPWRVLRRVAFAVERVASPGFVIHYALRKHLVRTELQRAVDQGFRQIVLLGAGFDMLSESLPAHIAVFEVDQPGTQQARLRAAHGRAVRPVSFVALNLRDQSLRAALHAVPSFDPNLATMWVAEGLLMYLSADRVEALLKDVADATRCEARFIFTVITPDGCGRHRLHSQRRVVDWCMRWLGEPFVWGVRPDEIATLVQGHSFRLERMVCTTELRDDLLGYNGRRRMPRPSGELAVVAYRLATDFGDTDGPL
jgi:methyltransferase (TIGR00027 family)